MSEFEWRIVLVRPRNPLNIGAAARAMANFGFHDLAVVNPYEPSWQETRSAVGAEEVVKSARKVDDLLEAIGGRTVVLGTTAGSRRNLDRELVPLPELSGWLASRAPMKLGAAPIRPGAAALLFGSEKTGLSTEHLSYCHALVRIPTLPKCPSMNLGQAVAVCCYELARAGVVAARPAGPHVHLSETANLHALEHVFERAVRVLDHAGYLHPKSRAAALIKLRRILVDLRLTNNDVKILGGILAQIEWKLRNP